MLKFQHNMVQRETLHLLSLGAPGHVTANLQAENWQKVDKFKPVYLCKYRL